MNNLKECKFVFVCPNARVVETMQNVFKHMPNWEFHCALFQDIPDCDTMVTAGNSYGIMDGGLDLAVRKYFGMGCQHLVQEKIAEDYFGLLPVGSAVVVPVDRGSYKHLIYTPTMRVPMDIRNTNYVAYAALAMFRSIAKAQEPMSKVVVPAFGVLTGKMDARTMARYILTAYLVSIERISIKTWRDAEAIENALNGVGGPLGSIPYY